LHQGEEMNALDQLIVHWIVPQINLLEKFLHIWESTKDGHVRVVVCGEKITINQALIAQ
jgi:hypothetical protein